jgi:hypothetical protein
MADYDIIGNIAIIKGEGKTKKEKTAQSLEITFNENYKINRRRKIFICYNISASKLYGHRFCSNTSTLKRC